MAVLKVHLKLLWIWLTSVSTATEFVNASDQLKAFEGYLNFQNIKHAIIIKENSAEFKAKDFEFLHENFSFRFFTLGSSSSASDFRSVLDRSQPRIGIFVPSFSILETASVDEFFGYSHSWFIMCSENRCTDDVIRQTFASMQLKMISDITIAREMNRSTLQLYDIYRMCSRDCVAVEIGYKGNWRVETGLNILPNYRREYLYRRNNFRQQYVKVSTAILEKPENISDMAYLADTKNNKQRDMMQRKAFALLNSLEEFYNLRFDVTFYPEWGKPLPNGSWTGVLGSVYSGETEFSICPLRGEVARARVLHYSPHIHTERIRFLLRHPAHTSIRNIFFKPLSPTVWWCILALMLVLTIQLGVHVRHEYRLKRAAATHIERRWDFVALQVLEAIFMQGPSPDLYTFLSTRTFIITTCIFSVMLQQFYSAFIVGSLLAVPPRTITTLAALYNSSLDIGMEDIPYNYEFFVNATNELARKIYTRRINKNPAANILSFQGGMERIGRGGFAFHVSLERAYQSLIVKLNECAFCELQDIAVYAPFSAFLITRQDSAYRDYLAMAIMKLRETGLMQYNDNLWSTPKIDCSLVQNLEVEVDLEHFTPALILLSSAIILTMGVFVLEVLWKWRETQMKCLGSKRRN